MKALRDASVTANDVIATHWKYPQFCADEIALRLDCGSAYVRKTLRRWNICVPSKRSRPGVGTPKDRIKVSS